LNIKNLKNREKARSPGDEVGIKGWYCIAKIWNVISWFDAAQSAHDVKTTSFGRCSEQ